MKEKLTEAIKKFPQHKVAVIGDTALDCFLYGTVNRINPENPGAPLIKINKEEYRLGCAANVAANLSSLNVQTSLHTQIGEDSHSQKIKDICKENGIKLFALEKGETLRKQRTIESEHGHYITRADYGESNKIKATEKDIQLFLTHLDLIAPQGIILSDYDKHIFSEPCSKKIVEYALSKNIPIIVDPKPSNVMNFHNATVFCPNIVEAREITGLKNESFREVAQQLKQKVNCKYAVITCGKDGIIIYDGNFQEIPTHAKSVVDVTGAGDTVASVLTLGLISGLDIVESAQLANYAAGIVVEKIGTSQVSAEELISSILEDS